MERTRERGPGDLFDGLSAKSTAIELLALAGHTKVHKSEEVHRLEISPTDASVLSAALTEARLHRDSSIIDITPIHTPLDTRD